jgi:hypothetical protein
MKMAISYRADSRADVAEQASPRKNGGEKA